MDRIVCITMIIGLVIVAIAMGILIDILRKWRRLAADDKSCLDIRTFDGLESPYHPMVLYFHEGWNGWEYWMAETPFSTRSKPYWDRNECPSIHVSHDGVNWTEPSGLINPLIDLTDKQIANLDYFSDPHLVYLAEKGSLELWFRLTCRGGDKGCSHNVKLLRMRSCNGVDWSVPEFIASFSQNLSAEQGLGRTVVSPAVIRQKSGYKIWYVDVEEPKEDVKRGVSFSESADGRCWTDRRSVSFDRDVNPWHIDVFLDNDKYLMLVYDLNNLTLWQSCDGLNFRFVKVIMNPSSRFGSVFHKLYRSCLVKDKTGYKIYVSGWDMIDTHIGLMVGDSLADVRLHHTDWLTLGRFIKHYCHYQLRRFLFVVRNLWNKL